MSDPTLPPSIPAAEISSGTVPDWTAGLPCLGAPSIAFTSTANSGPPSSNGSSTTPIAIGSLSPNGSKLFDSPRPGTLRYIGKQSAQFRVSFQVILTLTTDTSIPLPAPVSAPLAFRVILTVLLVNGAPVNSSAATEELGDFTGLTDGFENVSTFNGQALLTLNPKDEVAIGVTDILAGFVGQTDDSACVNALSLQAVSLNSN